MERASNEAVSFVDSGGKTGVRGHLKADLFGYMFLNSYCTIGK